jgi:hypothetical protein
MPSEFGGTVSPEDLDIMRAATPWAMALLSLIWAGLVLVINKTFAKRSDVDDLRNDHERLKTQVSELPDKEDIAVIKIAMEEIRGQTKEINAKLGGLEHMSRLLLENELKDTKHGNG